MAKKFKVIVELTIHETEMLAAFESYQETNSKPCPSHIAAIACDLQSFAYDEGGMHGEFNVLSVVPA